jgi:hypothetical protein
MASNDSYKQGFQQGQKNPSAQAATPQQRPNATDRNNYNAGLKAGQKK